MSKFKVNRVWFDNMFDDHDLTQRDVGKLLGIEASGVNRMLNGERALKGPEAEIFARKFKVTVEEVLHHAGQITLKGSRPRGSVFGDTLESYAAGNLSIEPSVSVVGRIDDEWTIYKDGVLGPQSVFPPMGVSDKAKALRFQTTDYMNGWVAYFMPTVDVTKDAVGQLCVVECADGRTLLRHVSRGYGDNDYLLGGQRGQEAVAAIVTSATPVLWMKQR